MKQLVYFLFITLPFLLLSQKNNTILGTYEFNYYGTKDGSILKRTITLNGDSTFLFHRYRKLICDSCKEENTYGKGTWKANKKLIKFHTSTSDLNEKHTHNLSKTKARFHSKSPRDKSNKTIPDQLIIYESDVFWLKGQKLIKQQFRQNN